MGIGDIAIAIGAVSEREGPRRRPQFFSGYADGVFGHRHIPAPTVGLIKPFGAAFDDRFRRE